MDDVGQVIDAIGGTGAVAELLGVRPSTVSSWKARSSIPAEYWVRIVAEADRRGCADVTFGALAGLHARRDAATEAAP